MYTKTDEIYKESCKIRNSDVELWYYFPLSLAIFSLAIKQIKTCMHVC